MSLCTLCVPYDLLRSTFHPKECQVKDHVGRPCDLKHCQRPKTRELSTGFCQSNNYYKTSQEWRMLYRSFFDCQSLSLIPHICHFFYTGRIFENQILHPKKRLKAPKTLKMSLKKSNICIFFTQSGKIYTWQKIFTQAPPVVPVTNMRYGVGQLSQFLRCS